MEALVLFDLLECPLCFKQLDVSAKVLPCQHTFCKPCLQRQEVSRSPLLCPECRTPARARSVEELPANLSLVRLLEGLQGSMGPGRGRQSGRYMVPLVRDNSTAREGQQQESLGAHNRERQGHTEVAARTLYSHRENTLGELDLALGDNTTSRHKVDESWHYADTNNSSGPVTANIVQGVHQMPQSQSLPQSQPQALCRALFDFNPKEMDLEDCRDCLTFLKGDILSVIRRVDEHWIEAKLGDKVGIFPLQFTEPNTVAAKLLEGKSRKGSDLAEFCQRIEGGSGGNDKAADALNRTAHFGAPQVPGKTPFIATLPLPGQGKQPSISGTLYHPFKGQPSNISALNSLNHQGQAQLSHFSAPPAPHGTVQDSRVTSHHVKRRSDTTHRHQSQGERKMNSETPPTVTMALVNPQTSSASADGKHASTQQLSISVCATLYSYKPRRPEELELRKGEMVGVYGMFKEGWLRGLSLRSGKLGILPSNYVTPVLRTSARLLETKAASASSSAVPGKRPTASKNPAVVFALDRVNTDGTAYSMGQATSVPNGAQHVMSPADARSSLYNSQGWDTVRRVFNPHRGSTHQGNHYTHNSNSSLPSHSQNFAQVQESGYSPALQRRKHSNVLPKQGRPLGWLADKTAPSAAAILKDRDFTTPKEATFDRQFSNGPHSILVRPDSHKNNTEKPTKSVRFLTEEDSPPPRLPTSSWSSGSQAACAGRPGPPPLEVWAPSLTLGRDGPGIILKEGKAPVLRKGLETAILDNLNYNLHKPSSAQTSLSAVSAQFSPSRHRVVTTYLAQTDSELSLLQGEPVLVHRPRPDGRVLVTQESSGQTGLFRTSVLQALERLS